MDERNRDAPRDGETVLPVLPETQAGLVFIGRIETPFARRADCPRQGDPEGGPDCRLHLDPRFAAALGGVERFERLELLYWLHGARRDLLTQSPAGKEDLRGTFSLRSPNRPNPIGTALVRLLSREGAVLTVRGLDCVDGTPLLDLKPARCDYAPLAKVKTPLKPS